MKTSNMKVLSIIVILFLIIGIKPISSFADSSIDTNSSNMKSQAQQTHTKSFKDISQLNWAYSYIMEGVSKGYISGDPGGTFRPNDPVTVAEFIKMLFMAMTDNSAGFTWWSEKYTENLPYSSLSILNNGADGFELGSPWYIHFINTAKGISVIQNEYDGNYNEKLTREKASRIINNFDAIFNGTYQIDYALFVGNQLFKDYSKVDTYLREAVADVGLRGIMVGNEQGNFNPKATISRAEVAKICSVVADKTKRTLPKNLNLSGAPISMVDTNFGTKTPYLFGNQEMKKVYDALSVAPYNGAVERIGGALGFYQNKEVMEEAEGYAQAMDFEGIMKSLYDGFIAFDGGAYTLRVSTADGRLARFSPIAKQLLSTIFKTSADDVYAQISNSASGKILTYDKVVEKREVKIDNEGKYVNVGISGSTAKG